MSANEETGEDATTTSTSRQQALSASSHWPALLSQLTSAVFALPLSFIAYFYSRILSFVGRPPEAPLAPIIRMGVTTAEQDEILETVPIMQRELQQELRMASVEQEKISQDMNHLKSRLARLEERRRQRKIKVDGIKKD